MLSRVLLCVLIAVIVFVELAVGLDDIQLIYMQNISIGPIFGCGPSSSGDLQETIFSQRQVIVTKLDREHLCFY